MNQNELVKAFEILSIGRYVDLSFLRNLYSGGIFDAVLYVILLLSRAACFSPDIFFVNPKFWFLPNVPQFHFLPHFFSLYSINAKSQKRLLSIFGGLLAITVIIL